MTWDRQLYFPSEGRRAEDFFALKNLTALAVFEPMNLGTEGHSRAIKTNVFKLKAATVQVRANDSKTDRKISHTHTHTHKD